MESGPAIIDDWPSIRLGRVCVYKARLAMNNTVVNTTQSDTG